MTIKDYHLAFEALVYPKELGAGVEGKRCNTNSLSSIQVNFALDVYRGEKRWDPISNRAISSTSYIEPDMALDSLIQDISIIAVNHGFSRATSNRKNAELKQLQTLESQKELLIEKVRRLRIEEYNTRDLFCNLEELREKKAFIIQKIGECAEELQSCSRSDENYDEVSDRYEKTKKQLEKELISIEDQIKKELSSIEMKKMRRQTLEESLKQIPNKLLDLENKIRELENRKIPGFPLLFRVTSLSENPSHKEKLIKSLFITLFPQSHQQGRFFSGLPFEGVCKQTLLHSSKNSMKDAIEAFETCFKEVWQGKSEIQSLFLLALEAYFRTQEKMLYQDMKSLSAKEKKWLANAVALALFLFSNESNSLALETVITHPLNQRAQSLVTFFQGEASLREFIRENVNDKVVPLDRKIKLLGQLLFSVGMSDEGFSKEKGALELWQYIESECFSLFSEEERYQEFGKSLLLASVEGAVTEEKIALFKKNLKEGTFDEETLKKAGIIFLLRMVNLDLEAGIKDGFNFSDLAAQDKYFILEKIAVPTMKTFFSQKKEVKQGLSGVTEERSQKMKVAQRSLESKAAINEMIDTLIAKIDNSEEKQIVRQTLSKLTVRGELSEVIAFVSSFMDRSDESVSISEFVKEIVGITQRKDRNLICSQALLIGNITRVGAVRLQFLRECMKVDLNRLESVIKTTFTLGSERAFKDPRDYIDLFLSLSKSEEREIQNTLSTFEDLKESLRQIADTIE